MATKTKSTQATRHKRLVDRIRSDPIFFAHNVLGTHLWSKQQEILRALVDNRRVAVRACHGPGKTYTAAIAVLWFLRLPGARVVTTATTWTQVRAVLWHEIAQLYRGSRVPLGGRLLQTELHLDDGRYALGLSTKPENIESFQGHHAPNLLLVFDEASGVPQQVYEAGEGYMTAPGARMLLIGNPIHSEGEFYRAFTTHRAAYSTHAISAFDTPAFTGEEVPQNVAECLVSKEWVEERRSWEGSPLWQVRVLGEFPDIAEDAVIGLRAVEDAQLRIVEPSAADERVVACDVARFGSNETVIAIRWGDRVRLGKYHVGKDLMQTCGAIINVVRQNTLSDGTPPRVVVDDDGVGGGVTDRLREQGVQVDAFRGGARPKDGKLYPNARSELWFRAAEALPRIDLDPDEQLAADLLAPRYKLDSAGRRQVERKEDTIKRLGRSPDRADAVLLTLVAKGSSGMPRTGGYDRDIFAEV